jgi:hypothetical protein
MARSTERVGGANLASRTEPKRVLLILVVVALCVTALVAIVALVVGELDDTGARVLATTAAMFVYSLTGLVGATLTSKRSGSVLGGATLLASAIGLLLMVILIWASSGGGDTDTLARAAFGLLVIALSCAQASLLQERRRERDGAAVAMVTTATQVTVAIVAAMIVLPLVNDDGPGDAYWRFLGIVAVLDLLGVLLLPILRRVERGSR